jgi:acetoin utilization deacetylase AcuC-like enzyme
MVELSSDPSRLLVGFYESPGHVQAGHVERPERVKTIASCVRSDHTLGTIEGSCSVVEYMTDRKASQEEIGLVHKYYSDLEARLNVSNLKQQEGEDYCICVADEGDPDGCTYATKTTFEDSRRACGTVLDLLEAIFDDACESKKGVCFVRPPGHHATGTTPLGFCIFNNVAIAAAYAKKNYDLNRVLVVDFDLHNGNGTAELFYDRPDIAVIDIHEKTQGYSPPEFVAHGVDAVGEGRGAGFTVNIPLEHKSGHWSAVRAMREVVEPFVLKYDPDLILVSAGFDGDQMDPFQCLMYDASTFEYFGASLSRLSDKVCDGKVLFVLEGGYNVESLGAAAVALCRGIIHGADLDQDYPSKLNHSDVSSAEVINQVAIMHNLKQK